MKIKKACPHCGGEFEEYKVPQPTVDIIIEVENKGIILIKRKNPPFGWALPGGFVDYGETLEQAAVREAKEETSLAVTLKGQLHTYSNPYRDPRFHTISTVFIGEASGSPEGKDDASEAKIFTSHSLPSPIAFDHLDILNDYFRLRKD
jgi:ADP-ribose pyrophosphatase YjhB (NUDIX family)